MLPGPPQTKSRFSWMIQKSKKVSEIKNMLVTKWTGNLVFLIAGQVNGEIPKEENRRNAVWS